MTNSDIPAVDTDDNRSLLARILSGDYGLAITYWLFYFAGAGAFFVFASNAVDSQQWLVFGVVAVAMLAYTFVLIVGIRAAYKGPQLWKVMSRTSSVFMIINILVGISTLGFIY
ncbi:MAG: amino acid transporter [Pseudohongiellaceae bacterium]|jgi:amino acid transporter